MAAQGFTSSYIDLSPSSSREFIPYAKEPYTPSGANLCSKDEGGVREDNPYTAALGASLQPECKGQVDYLGAEDAEDDDCPTPYVYATYSDFARVVAPQKDGKTHKHQAKQHKEEDDDGGLYTKPKMGNKEDAPVETVSNYTDVSTTRYSSSFESPRSTDELPPVVSSVNGYSTPVLTKDAAVSYQDAYIDAGSARKASSDSDAGYFPVLDPTPPSTQKYKKAAAFEQPDAAALADELMIRQKVAALLASLPSAKSRQRVVTQLKSVDDDADTSDSVEVLKPPPATTAQEKEWAKRGEGRQWNEEYQQVVSKGLKQLSSDDVRAISRLSHDFVKQAEIYSKIIINELNVPDQWKTIKPAKVGGVAGGAKYIVQGILFKFCLDPIVSKKPLVWLYGGNKPDDDHAMKAAGLELQGLGLIATSQIPQLHVPLMALIDYKGFRMVATCLLPIGKDTLKYGSNDAGRTIKAGDPVLDHYMHGLGEHLNLRKHLVGKQRVPIVGPGDIEGHLGTDSRYYLLDFARLMPPETPLPDENGTIDGRGVFFRMLRPELVRSFRVPLSSDTFTGWGMYDDQNEACELDVREATDIMINERVPELAAEISQLYEEGLCSADSITPAQMQVVIEHLNLVARMHARGVNLRHLGRIREKMTSPKGKRLVLSMALSRAFKTKLRKQMRQSVKDQKHAGASCESACKDVVLHFFNTVLGHTSESHHFWHVGIKKTMKKKFPFILTEEESDENYNLLKTGCIKLTFMLSFKLGLVRFPTAVTEAIFKDHTSVRLLETDILDIPTSVKHGHLSHVFAGNISMFEAAKPHHKASDAIRLLRQAREHLMTAANMTPSCPYTNWVLASIEVDIASRLQFDQEAERLFASAYVRFARSCELDKTNAGPLSSWADALEQHAARLAANDADPARLHEMRTLATAKRQLAASKTGVSTCHLITSPRG